MYPKAPETFEPTRGPQGQEHQGQDSRIAERKLVEGEDRRSEENPGGPALDAVGGPKRGPGCADPYPPAGEGRQRRQQATFDEKPEQVRVHVFGRHVGPERVTAPAQPERGGPSQDSGNQPRTARPPTRASGTRAMTSSLLAGRRRTVTAATISQAPREKVTTSAARRAVFVSHRTRSRFSPWISIRPSLPAVEMETK